MLSSEETSEMSKQSIAASQNSLPGRGSIIVEPARRSLVSGALTDMTDDYASLVAVLWIMAQILTLGLRLG